MSFLFRFAFSLDHATIVICFPQSLAYNFHSHLMLYLDILSVIIIALYYAQQSKKNEQIEHIHKDSKERNLRLESQHLRVVKQDTLIPNQEMNDVSLSMNQRNPDNPTITKQISEFDFTLEISARGVLSLITPRHVRSKCKKLLQLQLSLSFHSIIAAISFTLTHVVLDRSYNYEEIRHLEEPHLLGCSFDNKRIKRPDMRRTAPIAAVGLFS